MASTYGSDTYGTGTYGSPPLSGAASASFAHLSASATGAMLGSDGYGVASRSSLVLKFPDYSRVVDLPIYVKSVNAT